MKTNQNLVPQTDENRFAALCEFYRAKNKLNGKIFSCSAAEEFPLGWQKAFKSGRWTEEGQYGDNFRNFFGISK